MKKLSLIFAMAAIVLTSCLKEEAPVVNENGAQDNIDPSEVLVEKVFTTGDVDSKTYIDGTMSASNKMVIKWCADDEIAVWDGTAYRKFTIDGEPNGNSATFKGMVSEGATEFYAIYPYSENLQYNYNETRGWMEFTVLQPAVQYANPEGGLADKTAFACGKADENGNIKFLNRSALLKFSLANGMDVKSVTITGNEEDDIIAGTLDMRYNASNNFTLGWKAAGKSNQLTLTNEDGSNLKTGVDYYIALTGNTFGAGYSVTFTFADGTTMTRNSDKAIQLMSNQIYTLSKDPISRVTLGATYYELYLGGEDIVIGGKVYNKTTHPNATLLTETSTISANGLYFLDPAEGQTISLGTSYFTNLAIVGNKPDQKVKVENGVYYLNANAKLALMNVHVPAPVGNQTIQEPTAGADYVIFENCKIEQPEGNSICFNTAAGTCIAEFVMKGCDYLISKTAAEHSSGAFMLNCYMNNSTIILVDNLFYVTVPDVPVLKFKVTTRSDTTPKALVMSNNTFVNILANGGDSGFYKNGIVFTSVDVRNNLFYVTGMTRNNTVFMTGTSFGGGVIENNAYYKADLTYTFRMFNGSQNTPAFASTDLTKLSASPFSDMDHTNGVFVKTADAAAYGAKR